MRLKHLGAIALSTAAALAAIAPAPAGAATSSACAGGSFSVTLPGGKTLAPSQSAKLAASALPAGSRLHVQGRYVQFDVSVSDFSVYDWALTGAANPEDLTGGRFTPIWASKVADLKGATLDRELEVKPTDAAGSGLLLQRTGSAKMKIQAKDCATGGVFQIEGEVGTTPVTFTHTLAPGVHYFVSPFTGKTQIGNDDRLIAKDSPMAATRLTQTATTSTWSVQAGGRMGFVLGEDAVETTVPNPSNSCTQQCQVQNQIRGTLTVPDGALPGGETETAG